MSTIISVSEKECSIKFDDGKILSLPKSSCVGFSPLPGMDVEVVFNGSNYIVKLAENSKFNANFNQRDDKFADCVNVRPFGVNNHRYIKASKVIYLLLLFFFGMFGLHRFYLGRIKSGIIYFLCSTVGSILILPPVIIFILLVVDFFKTLFKDTDEDGNTYLE